MPGRSRDEQGAAAWLMRVLSVVRRGLTGRVKSIVKQARRTPRPCPLPRAIQVRRRVLASIVGEYIPQGATCKA